ncbi:cytochrome P450 306a1-like [Zophobas morio]|uniref:cytochrome P450 306a1-like n=1 Tax=Zophobas morio TaxID=2755281 RepID=UPI003083D40C
MLLVALVTILTLTLLLYITYRKKRLPGPWNLPIIGYIHKLDPVAPYLTLTKLAQKYGPVYGIKLGLMDVAVIADGKILKKVLAKNETIERPPLYMLNTVFEGKGIVYTSGHVWKNHRKLVANFFKMTGANKFSPNKKSCEALIEKYVDEFIQVVTTQGDYIVLDPWELVTRYVTSVASTLLQGKPFSWDDENFLVLRKNLDVVGELSAPGTPLNFLPFLRFLPQFKEKVNSLKVALRKIREIQSKLIDDCRKSTSDFSSNLIEIFLLQISKDNKDMYDLDQLPYLVYDLYMAFTTAPISYIMWIFLHMAQHEDIQDKVRQEILEVGQGKKIEMNDLANLHYTKATIAEVGRISTTGPLGFPHYASQDICVEGFHIAKGTTIMPLLWGIHMDPNVWKNPEEFRPERFLTDDGKFYKPEAFVPFQSGKRICVGDEITITIASMLIARVLQNFKLGCVDSSPIDFTGVCGITFNSKPQEILFTKI